MGREPGPDDLVVPRPASCRAKAGAMHTKSTAGKQVIRDLATVGIRKRAMPLHSLRSTFISQAKEDGADDYLLSLVTHPGKSREAFDLYMRIGWEPLCREIAKLRIERPDPASQDSGHSSPDVAATFAATLDEKVVENQLVEEWRRRESNSVRRALGWAGFRAVSAPMSRKIWPLPMGCQPMESRFRAVSSGFTVGM